MLRTQETMPKQSWLDRPLLAAINLDWEKGLYLLFIALAIFSRFWDLGVRVMSHDETVHVQWSWYLFQGRGYSHTPLSHGPFLFHATALSYYLFGDSDFSARLVVAIMGIILVALPYTLRRWLGRSGALVASFLFLISPSLLYYSRYIRHDIPVIVWSLIAIAAIFRYLEAGQRSLRGSPEPAAGHHPRLFEGQMRWLVLLAAALSLMLATKEVSFIYIAIFGVFLILLFFARLGTPRWQDPAWERWGRTLLWIALGALIVTTVALALSSIVDKPSSSETDVAVPSFDEALGPEPTPSETVTTAADLLRGFARLSAIAAVLVLMAYLGLVMLGSPSHQQLILTVLGLVTIVLLVMVLFLFSLNLVELFPIRYRDCGQAPVPGAAAGEMQCTEADCKLIQGSCQRPLPVITGGNVLEFDETGTRIAIQLTRPEMLIVVVLIGTFTLLTGVSVYALLQRLMPFQRGERPALDLVIFIGSFALPFLSAFMINGLSHVVSRSIFGIDASFNSLDYSEAGLLRSAGFVFILLAASVAVGLWWDWRRWLASAAVFYVIFIVLFTTVFTNGNGLASGMVGSLGYWLEQQDVQRGSQPSYYYALLVPLYEYLPLIGFFVASLFVALRLKPKTSVPSPASDENEIEHPRPPGLPAVSIETVFVLFLLFWTAMTWLAYSVAGEKMPWLTTHFAVPLALTTGWVMGKLIDRVRWRAVLRQGGWVVILVAPVALAALVQTLSPWLKSDSPRPFSGYGLGQLNTTMQFLSALLVLSASIGLLVWARRRIGLSALGRTLALLAFAVLAVLTIRTAWLFAFVNYDYASEFLVYAHSTPDVREVMEQIEDISRRTSGELSLDIGYTGDGSYPFIWYLRNYPNATQLPNPPSRVDLEKSVIIAGDKEWGGIEPYLGETYTCNHYNFLWWPMQDYYGLTWDRIRYALTNPEMRAAVWDIILRRDYREYERVTGKTVHLSEWPLRDRFRFCFRRDLTAQMWSESAGPVAFVPEVSEIGPPLPDYAGLTRPAAAELVVSTLDPFGSFNAPHGVALDADGFLYVADSNNHRIVKISPDGQAVDTWDSTWWRGLQNWKPGCLDASDRPLALGDGEFCEPWSIAVGPDNKVYVADTWNHRIQIFTAEGEFLAKFGTFGQSGSSVSSAPTQFYGPRDVVVDEQGYIYVTDTGNKRIQVFDADLDFIRAFGGPGIIEGRLEEPVGLATGPDNLLYVADTWNLRIQVFTLEGTYVREWPVVGWASQSVANKPYVATDSSGRVYVTDPEGGQLLIFDAEGTPLVVIGGSSSTLFQLPTGVILDSQDRLWVSDAANQRLLRFPPPEFDQEGNQP
jgi:uncharacterized protein (TIGR03663 family)